MSIVGCDFHPSWQQVAVLDTESGEIRQHKLTNGNGDAERFYRQLPVPSLIGLEASGNTDWFEAMLLRLGHIVWIGDATKIRASYVRKQKWTRSSRQVPRPVRTLVVSRRAAGVFTCRTTPATRHCY